MPQNALSQLNSAFAQCDLLIADAHRQDANGLPIFSALTQEQITHAAFLNMFISWETFLEEILAAYMTGSSTINGNKPSTRVSPASRDDAKKMMIGVMKYFDFSNHKFVKDISRIYFQNSYPIEPHLSAIESELADLKKMRNACAHTSSTTQVALETLALRIFGMPIPGISVYRIITSIHPSYAPDTVYLRYRNVLQAAATQIAHG